MKRSIFCVLLMAFFCIGCNALDWKEYLDAREACKQAKVIHDFDQIRDSLLRYAKAARAVNRPDIEAWQYNNAAYYCIEEFKDRTDYVNILNNIFNIPKGKQLDKAIFEAYNIFLSEYALLKEADGYMNMAWKIQMTNPDIERNTKMKSNSDFLLYVAKFMADNTPPKTKKGSGKDVDSKVK